MIRDCAVGEWKPEPCTAECMGGVQNQTRDVIQEMSLGANCPALTMEKPCNQFPCPVNCEMDEWSGWGKCSKECGGGVQGRVRNVIVRADNGGDACDPREDE